MFEKYTNTLTSECACGVETGVTIEAAILEALHGCADCGEKVKFTFPNKKPSDKKGA